MASNSSSTAPITNDETEYLVYEGAGPFTVYAKINDEGKAEFAASATSGSYPKIKWLPEKGVGQFTFIFLLDTISQLVPITPGLTFGTVSGNQQVGTCSSAPNHYHFGVDPTGGDRMIDPVIVVSIPPNPNPDPC